MDSIAVANPHFLTPEFLHVSTKNQLHRCKQLRAICPYKRTKVYISKQTPSCRPLCKCKYTTIIFWDGHQTARLFLMVLCAFGAISPYDTVCQFYLAKPLLKSQRWIVSGQKTKALFIPKVKSFYDSNRPLFFFIRRTVWLKDVFFTLKYWKVLIL